MTTEFQGAAWDPNFNDPTSLGVANVDAIMSDPVFERLAKGFDVEVAYRHVLRGVRLMHTSGRWEPFTEDPDTLIPGDLPIVRGIVLNGHINEIGQRLRAQDPNVEGLDLTVLSLSALSSAISKAVPFFLDGPTAMGVLTSTPPDPEIVDSLRLPFDSVFVGFGKELELPDDIVWPDLDPDRPHKFHGSQSPMGFNTPLETAVMERGGTITGLVLLAGEDGVGLSDFVAWIVSANPDRDHPDPAIRNDRQRGAVVAYRHKAIWRHIIDNVAAAVAWFDWREPDELELPDPLDERAWKKATNKGRFRRKEPWGAAGGVRTVDVNRDRTAPKTTGSEDPPRASRATHVRSGHWRAVRIATRDEHGNIIGDVHGVAGVDWHPEGRWIRPTVVNPAGTRDERAVVYRIPPQA